jgi:hypothetical protein
MKLIYLKSAYKFDSFDVSIGKKIPSFRVSVTIEPGRSLLTVRYHEFFDKLLWKCLNWQFSQADQWLTLCRYQYPDLMTSAGSAISGWGEIIQRSYSCLEVSAYYFKLNSISYKKFFNWKKGVTLKVRTNRNYSIYERGCPLLSAPLFTVKYLLL